MPPILFGLRRFMGNPTPSQSRSGVASVVIPQMGPPQGQRYRIAGVTRDAGGNALAGCTVVLIAASGARVDTATSDGAGNFTLYNVGQGQQYQVSAYHTGTPDVAGVTVNSLSGQAF